MATWAPCLKQFKAEYDARKPGRNTSSDGWIGDSAHQKRKSDHNPNKKGVVTAGDFTTIGWDHSEIMSIIDKVKRDWRTAYVIYQGTIWNRRNGFKAAKSSGHENHFHISTLNYLNIGLDMGEEVMVKAWNDTSSWLGGLVAPTPAPSTQPKSEWGDDSMPLGLKSKGPRVAALQMGLLRAFPRYAYPIRDAGGADGYFGEATKKVVMEFQRRARLSADGVVGAKTQAALRAYGVRF